MNHKKILIIDDEPNIRRSVKIILQGEGYHPRTASGGQEALDMMAQDKPDAIFLDIMMPDLDGLTVLKKARARYPDLIIIIVSGFGTVQNAVEATRYGAYDFIEKPISKEKLLLSLQRAFENQRLQQENLELKRKVAGTLEMLGESNALKIIKQQITRVAPTNGRVLILGESGTGKELVAHAIHAGSTRKDQPFIKVNCAAIAEELIESELFGSEKGAYTGSVERKEGKFAQADKGTIFLDEIGDMSLKVQAKVLRVLQEGEIERVGGHQTLKVDVRVIAATNKNLEEEVKRGCFREDLYFRLNVIPIYIPPLRERKSDIPILVHHFTETYCRENGFRAKLIDKKALAALIEYHWPGNIRELKNIIERMVIMSGTEQLTLADLPPNIQSPQLQFKPSIAIGKTLKQVREETEQQYILACLEHNQWNITSTAKMLGIERTNLHKKLNYYGIQKE